MKRLIITTAVLLLPWLAHGQLLIDPYRFSTPFTPASLPTIRHWWIHSDLVADAPITNWIARISGFGLGQASVILRPTNSSTGVHFPGTLFLTNSPSFNEVVGTTGSVWVCITPITPASFGGIVAGSSGAGRGIFTTSGNVFRVFGESGSPTFGAFVSGNALDIAIGITSVSTNAFWTNGVLNSVQAAGAIFNNDVNFAGKDGSGLFYNGRIREIAFFTGLLTATEVANLHTYATNLYGYTP